MHKLTFSGLEVESFERDSIELNITPNRGDCLSLLGIAREVGALFDLKITEPKILPIEPASSEKFAVDIRNSEYCPNYIGRVISNINAIAKTPKWMQERLEASGINSISPVVDITNYVMLELGQPMHAFDLNKLNGKIIVRLSNANEKIILLDGQEVTLDNDTLVIADEKFPLAIAGVMGGEYSAVSLDTKNIFLESAFFNPVKIRNSVQKYNIHSDSSYRFERQIDVNFQEKAIERATQLILEIVGGEPGPVIKKLDEKNLPKFPKIKFNPEKIRKILGINAEVISIKNILDKLNFKVESKEDILFVTPPSFRSDIQIEEDIVEEIARIQGYDELPIELPNVTSKFNLKQESLISELDIKNVLVYRGYNEAITYSFIDPSLASIFHDSSELISLKNPISADMSVMRPSLIPGLVNAVKYNQSRQEKNIKLFEVGLRFLQKRDEILQERIIAGIITGNVAEESWSEKPKIADFYDLKGDVEALFSKSNIEKQISFEPINEPFLHSGQTAAIYKEGVKIGLIGAMHPGLIAKLDLIGPVFVFEIDLNKLTAGSIAQFKPLSKFPAVRRDLAFLVDKNLLVQNILEEIQEVSGNILKEVKVFDIYQGKGIPEDKKSIAVGLIFQDDKKTLVDEEVNSKVIDVTTRLKNKFSIALRD